MKANIFEVIIKKFLSSVRERFDIPYSMPISLHQDKCTHNTLGIEGLNEVYIFTEDEKQYRIEMDGIRFDVGNDSEMKGIIFDEV